MEEYILSHGSYLAIILIITLTGAGLPIPEEVPIVAAGVLSSPAVGRLNPTFAFLACLVGALLGDSLMYAIGRYLGSAFLRRHPLFARLLHGEREKQMEALIERQGLKVFLLARFMVGVRAPVYMAAGVMRMKFATFLLVDAVCASIVVGTFFWLSCYFGHSMGPLFRDSQLAFTALVLVLVALGGIYYFAWRKYRKQLHLDEPPNET
jgi:membrane protein DedA with SNARE-associated domain